METGEGKEEAISTDAYIAIECKLAACGDDI
jgi:hypothetical protein